MKSKICFSLVILAGSLLPALAQAQSSLVELANFSFASSTLPSTLSPASVSVAKFDTTLGTLNSVTLSLQASGTVFAQAFNLTGTSQSYDNSTAALNFGVKGPDGTQISINPSTALFAGTAAVGLQNTGSAAFALSPADLDVALANLNWYEGAGGGNFTLSFNSGAKDSPITSSIRAISGVFTGGDADVSGSVNVTYNYTAIPEPSVYALIVGGAAFASVIGRQKRRVRQGA